MSGFDPLIELRHAKGIVAPSLLMCDFGRLADEVAALEAAGVRLLHLDVMDGHFVPNLSYGLPLVETFRRLTSLPLDVHLMISNPGDYVGRYRDAGADILTIHIEATNHPQPVLETVRASGAWAGLALNPSTPLERITPHLDLCDLVLVMSVEPGFGAQPFEPVALEKLRALRKLVPERTVLEVDGGVNTGTIAACTEAGADWMVVGSAIFRSEDYSRSVRELTSLTS